MRYLSAGEVLELYRRVIEETGGASGVRDLSALLSSIAQPRMTFEGQDLYPDLADKAAALGFSIVMNHPFLDGNKRTAHAAMEAFLLLNGHELLAATPEQEQVLLGLADGKLTREQFASWIANHLQRR
jgi:death-on-curing protein